MKASNKRTGASASTGTTSKSAIASRGAWRRERLLARWRLSTILAAVVAIAAVGAVLATGLSLGGFGIPTDSSPRVISSGAVPFGLLSRTSPPTAPPVTAHNQHTEVVNLYFIGQNNHLALVYAEIPRPVTIQSELNELFNGPGSAQAGAPGNLLTYIPAGTSVISATVTPTGLATLDLSPDIENAIGEELIQAFAQMVYTITWPTACHKIDTGPLPRTTPPPPRGFETPCVDKVVFEVDGVPQQVPIADGAQTNQPTTRADYKSLL